MAVASVGTGLNSPPIALINTMDALTAKLPEDEIADNVFYASPTLWSLIRFGKKKESSELVYPLVTQETTTNGAYSGSQLLDTSTIDDIQPANQVWRPYQQTISIPLTDIKLNSGPDGILDIVESKMETGFASLMFCLARAAWHITPQNTSQDVDDIDSWVRQTANTIAGINRSSNAFWQPRPNVGVAAAGAITENDMEKAVLSSTWGYDQATNIIMCHTDYRVFKEVFTALTRYERPALNEEAIEAGFRKQFMYDNALVMPERMLEDFTSAGIVPNKNVYLINTKYLYAVFHAKDYFQFQPWDKPTNQEVLTTRITLIWQIKCNNPRMQVALTGFTGS